MRYNHPMLYRNLATAIIILAIVPYLILKEPEPAFLTDGSLGGVETQQRAILDWRAEREEQPLPGYLYSEMVTLDDAHPDYHDESCYFTFKFADHPELSGPVDKSRFEVVSAWTKGRRLHVCYGEASGPAIFDSDTQIVIPVHSSLPIKSYLDSLLAVSGGSTFGLVTIGVESQRVYHMEIDRFVRRALTKKNLPDHMRRHFIKLSWARGEYYEAQRAFASMVNWNYMRGSGIGPMNVDYYEKLNDALLNQLYQLGLQVETFDGDVLHHLR